jgi:hypothetical protein
MSLKLQVELSIRGYIESFKDKGSKTEIPEGYFENYVHKNLWKWKTNACMQLEWQYFEVKTTKLTCHVILFTKSSHVCSHLVYR